MAYTSTSPRGAKRVANRRTDQSWTMADEAALQAALDGKEPTIAAGATAQYWRGDKSWQTLDKAAVGLGNVDNTSDANKPVSTAQQAALDMKLNISAVSAFGLTLIDDADAATARATLGITGTGADTTYAFRANNLSDLANAGTARTNLGLGTGDSPIFAGLTVTNIAYFNAEGLALGGLTDQTEIASGWTTAPAPAIMEIGKAHAGVATSTEYGALVLSNNQTGTANTVGGVFFANRAIAAAEKRLAQIVCNTNGVTDTGSLRFAIMSAGTLAVRAILTATALDMQTDIAISFAGTGAATTRNNLGLGTAATVNTGTSGATIPLLNGTNVWSNFQDINSHLRVTGSSTPATGTGLELLWNSGSAFSNIITINRATTAYQEMRLTGLTVSIRPSGTETIKVAGTGVQLTVHPTTASAANAFIDTADSNYLKRSTSAGIYKTDVIDLTDSRADRLLSLRPVRYRSLASGDNPDWSYYGLVAEEVAAIDPRLVHWGYQDDQFDIVEGMDEDGLPFTQRTLKAGATLRPDAVQYDRLTIGLVQMMKRARATLQSQSQRITDLEARLASIEAVLSAK